MKIILLFENIIMKITLLDKYWYDHIYFSDEETKMQSSHNL